MPRTRKDLPLGRINVGRRKEVHRTSKANLRLFRDINQRLTSRIKKTLHLLKSSNIKNPRSSRRSPTSTKR